MPKVRAHIVIEFDPDTDDPALEADEMVREIQSMWQVGCWLDDVTEPEGE